MNTDYLIAKILFSIAFVILLIRTGWWLIGEQKLTNSIISYISIFLIFGFISLLWFASIKWVEYKEKSVVEKTEDKLLNIALKPNFKLTLLGGNIFIPEQLPKSTGVALYV